LDILAKKDIDINTAILVAVSYIPKQDVNLWLAFWLSYDKRFFDIMASYKTHKLFEVDAFGEAFPEISEHCKGTGKSSAYLALELLESSVNKYR
jgi:hypothetical protein